MKATCAITPITYSTKVDAIRMGIEYVLVV